MKKGMMISEIAFSNMPVLLKSSGLDFCILDCEHGGFDYADAARMIMTAKLCGLEFIVRLPGNARKDIVKFMDMGANGLLLPMTNKRKDIEEVVRFDKYQPIGQRGISTMRAHTLYSPPSIVTYMTQANSQTKVFAQIETRSGIENAEDILAVPGVDGCFVGPNDLSADLGVLEKSAAAEILTAIERIGAIAEKVGKASGIITSNREYLQKSKKSAFTLFCIGSELNALADYCRKIPKILGEALIEN